MCVCEVRGGGLEKELGKDAVFGKLSCCVLIFKFIVNTFFVDSPNNQFYLYNAKCYYMLERSTAPNSTMSRRCARPCPGSLFVLPFLESWELPTLACLFALVRREVHIPNLTMWSPIFVPLKVRRDCM